MKKLSVVLISFCLLIGFTLSGCNRVGSSLNGSGNIIDQPINISGFTKISAGGAFPIEISQAEVSSVTVSTDDNLINRVRVTLEGETLQIGIQAPGSFLPTSLKIQVRMPRIYALTLMEGAKASLSGFKSTYNFSLNMQTAAGLSGYLEAGNLDFNLSGASQVNLKGTALSLSLEALTASKLDLSDFPLNSASVKLRDASEATIEINGRLTSDLAGASKLYYLGNPLFSDTSISGGSIMQPR